MAARCTHPKRVKIMTEAGKKFKGGMQWVGAGDAHIYTCGKGEKGLAFPINHRRQDLRRPQPILPRKPQVGKATNHHIECLFYS